MRRFQLRRTIDHSGVSGTGIIAEGIIFSSGAVVMSWVVPPAGMTRVPKGLAIYEDVPHLVAIHGHGGDTVVEYLDCQDCGADISRGHLYCVSCGNNTVLCSGCRDEHRRRHEGAEQAGVLV